MWKDLNFYTLLMKCKMLKPFWFQTLSSVSRYFWKNIYNVTLLRRQFWFWIILLFKAWDISFSLSYASKGKKGIEFSRVLCKFKEKNVLFSMKENWAYSISDPSLYKNHGGWKYYYKIASKTTKVNTYISKRRNLKSHDFYVVQLL